MTVHRRDDRQLDVEQVPDELLRVAPERLQAAGLLEGGEPGEVAAGREGPASPGEEYGTRLALASERGEERRQVVVQAIVDGVERAFRVVDRDPQHLPDALDPERGEVAGVHSIEVSASSPRSIRPASSSVAGATMMCWVATWMSRNCRWRGLIA